MQLRDRSYILRTPYSYLYSMMSALFHGLPNAPRTSAGTSSLSDCANAPGIVSHCQPQVYSLSRIWPLPPALSLHIQNLRKQVCIPLRLRFAVGYDTLQACSFILASIYCRVLRSRHLQYELLCSSLIHWLYQKQIINPLSQR